MTMNSTISAVNSTSTSNQVSTSNVNTESSTKNDTSFKQEMEKVSTKEEKKADTKESATKTDSSNTKISESKDTKKSKTSDSKNSNTTDNNQLLQANASFNVVSAYDNNNNQLSDDIREMYNIRSLDSTKLNVNSSSDKENSISMTQADADFFITLTQNNEIDLSGMQTQTNTMNDSNNVANVEKSSQVSQVLLDALANSRENNQPVRVDFDNNMSVILRVSKDGILGANFIPGDKAVEQYLKDNISNLKASFEQNDLPYSELSYSNRGGKQQREQQKNKQQKG